jgi:regulator of sigma E protease
VAQDGPAAKAGIASGKRVTKVELIPPEQKRKWYQLFSGPNSETIELTDKKPSWPYVFVMLQRLKPGTTVKLTLDDGASATLDPDAAHDWFNPERGLNFEPRYALTKADSLVEAVRLGTIESVESVTLVYRFLSKIGRQVSPKAAGGPIIIAEQAFHSANRGISELLIFLTMLSANLAVINFLPIPLLDGGHMVFLIYEGIRGKPASERIVLAFHYAGFLFILSLMAFVFMLDLGIISRFAN